MFQKEVVEQIEAHILCSLQNDHIQHKNKINGNVWELHTEGQNCDKQQYY